MTDLFYCEGDKKTPIKALLVRKVTEKDLVFFELLLSDGRSVETGNIDFDCELSERKSRKK